MNLYFKIYTSSIVDTVSVICLIGLVIFVLVSFESEEFKLFGNYFCACGSWTRAAQRFKDNKILVVTSQLRDGLSSRHQSVKCNEKRRKWISSMLLGCQCARGDQTVLAAQKSR